MLNDIIVINIQHGGVEVKRKIYKFFYFFILLFIFLVGCSTNNSEVKNQSAETTTNTNGNILNKEQKKKEKITKIVELFDKDIKWLDDGRSRGKFIEDTWEENKEDEELSALYYYDSTLFFLGVNETEKAKEQMRKISPDYNGVYSQKIIELGIKLFGSKENWKKQYAVAIEIKERTEQRKKSGDKTLERNVMKYIEDRCKYYGSTGDKTMAKVMKEAAEKYNVTVEEIEEIWSNPDNLKFLNSSSDSNNNSITQSDGNKSISNANENDPDAISLYYGGSPILVGVTDKALSDAIKSIVNKDEYRFQELVSQGLLFEVPSGTKAKIIDRKLTMNKVRILEGVYKGQAGWVVVEATKK